MKLLVAVLLTISFSASAAVSPQASEIEEAIFESLYFQNKDVERVDCIGDLKESNCTVTSKNSIAYMKCNAGSCAVTHTTPRTIKVKHHE